MNEFLPDSLITFRTPPASLAAVKIACLLRTLLVGFEEKDVQHIIACFHPAARIESAYSLTTVGPEEYRFLLERILPRIERIMLCSIRIREEGMFSARVYGTLKTYEQGGTMRAVRVLFFVGRTSARSPWQIVSTTFLLWASK